MSEAAEISVEEEPGREFMSAVKRRRMQDRKEWEAYWAIRDKETEGTYYPRFVYKMNRIIDRPVTWFRENIVEPLHDKHKMPYYHRKINRVPEIDQCCVNDPICVYEAEEQFRMDKLVDYYIKNILYQRFSKCIHYHGYANSYKCAQQIDDYESADLNFFIKYGELGSEQTVAACYMKQKHRLIWERRNPEIMAERKRAYEQHMENLRNGKFNMHFWKPALAWKEKRDYSPRAMFTGHWDSAKLPMEGDHAISRDWRYYQKLDADPTFDTVNYPKKWNKLAQEEKDRRDQKKQMEEGGNGTNGNGQNGNGTNGNGQNNNGTNGNGQNGNATNGNGHSDNGNKGNGNGEQ